MIIRGEIVSRQATYATCFAVLLCAGASAQQLTPRDAFWSSNDLVAVPQNSAAAPGKAVKKPAPRTSLPATAVPTASVPSHAAPKHIDPAAVATNGYGAAPHLVRVSDEEMGMRYSLLMKDGSGEYVEVSPRQTFHTGDRIQLSVMANRPGYLYVIDKGSSGKWTPLYPAPGAAPEENRVQAGKPFSPPRVAFRFDPPSGEEKLYLIVSREPLTDLDTTIRNLKGPERVSQPTQGAGQLLEASNRIPDDLMEHLVSRDLSLVQEQEVDGRSASNAGENAVYVTSKGIPPGAKGPEVVAVVTLKHD